MADFFQFLHTQLVPFLQTEMWFTLIWGGVMGAVMGSFLNVVILRWPARMEREWQSQAREILGLPEPDAAGAAPPGIHEHSRCPHCQARIRWFDNVPVLSYLWLRGQCRRCKAPISAQYPLVEALGGLGTMLMILNFGATPTTLMAASFWLILLTLSVIDLRTMLLPDPLVYVLLWAGLLGSALGVPHLPSLPQAVWGAALGYGSLWAFCGLFKLIRGKEGMGHGDFKLLAALGAWCGALNLMPIVVVATGAGLFGALLALLAKRDPMAALPFGPSLAVGGVVTFLWPGWFPLALESLRHLPLVLAIAHP